MTDRSHSRFRFLWHHWKLLLGVAAGLAFVLWLTFAPKVVEVDTAVVRRGPMEVTVDEDGITRYQDVYKITAPVAGEMRRIDWKSGDAVKRGELLATIRPTPSTLLDPRSQEEAQARVQAAQAAVQQAAAQVKTAAEELAQAERYVTRDQRRLKERLISPPVLEDSRQALQVANSSHEGALAAQEMAEFDLQAAQAALRNSSAGPQAGTKPQSPEAEFPLTAPVAGVVIAVPEESGRVVAPGETILELGDPRTLEVRADLLSQDAVRVKPGQSVRVEQWGGAGVIQGTVTRVEPTAFTKVSALGVDEQRVWVTIDLDPEAAENALGHNYRVEVRIITWEDSDALLAAAGAVFRSGTGWAAYRVNRSGRAEEVPLTIGHRTPAVVQVLSGLQPGDRLILHPGDRVEPGAKLRLR